MLQLFPHRFDLWRRVIRNIRTFPGKDLHEIGPAFLVSTAEKDVGVVEDEADRGIQRPGFRSQLGIFRLVSWLNVRDAVNGFGSASGKLRGGRSVQASSRRSAVICGSWLAA